MSQCLKGQYSFHRLHGKEKVTQNVITHWRTKNSLMYHCVFFLPILENNTYFPSPRHNFSKTSIFSNLAYDTLKKQKKKKKNNFSVKLQNVFFKNLGVKPNWISGNKILVSKPFQLFLNSIIIIPTLVEMIKSNNSLVIVIFHQIYKRREKFI